MIRRSHWLCAWVLCFCPVFFGHAACITPTQHSYGSTVELPTPYQSYDLVVNQRHLTVQFCASNTRPIDFPASINTLSLLSELAKNWQSGDPASQDKAIVALTHLIANNPTSPVATRLRYSLASANFFRFNYTAAIAVIQHALNGSHDAEYEADFKLLLAEIYLRQQRFNAALEILLDLQDNDRENHFSRKFKTLILLAEVQLVQGKLLLGERSLKTALSIYNGAVEYVFDPADVITLYDNYAYLFIEYARNETALRTEHLERALAYEFTALKFAKEHNNVKKEIVVRSNIAWLNQQIFAFDSAEHHLIHTLRLLESSPDPDLQNHIYRTLGRSYFYIGLYHKARVYLEAAIELSEQSNEREYGKMHCRLAQVSYLLQDFQSVQPTLNECLRLLELKDVRPETLATALTVQLQMSDIEGASIPEQQTLSERLKGALDDVNDDNIKIEGFIELAHFAINQNDTSAIAQWFAELVKLEPLVSPTLQIKSRKLQYLYFHKNPSLEASAEFALDTHTLILKTLVLFEPSELGPAWKNSVITFYTSWLTNLLREGTQSSTEQALSVSLLLNDINAFSNKLSADSSPEGLRKVSQLQAQLLNSSSTDIESELAHLIAWDIGRVTDTPASDTYSNHYSKNVDAEVDKLHEILNITGIQKQLATDQQLLFYLYGESDLYLFLVRSSDIVTLKIASIAEVVQHLTVLNEGVGRRGGISLMQLQDAANLLFPAEVQSSDYSHWLIMSNQGLVDQPLVALASQLDKAPQEVSRLLSFQQQTRNDTALKGTVSIIAAPELADQSIEWIADLDDLPWSKREARQVNRLFNPALTMSYTGHLANRETLFSEIVRGSSILHIATHHVFDPSKPQYVGLILSAANHSTFDGAFISELEIRQNQFSSELVFLNGCATGQGRQFAGAGAMSVSRAFLNAGARHVVSTLWKVSDRASVQFAEYFYDAYLQGKSPAASVMSAMSKMRANPRFRDPFYWAAYEVAQTGL